MVLQLDTEALDHVISVLCICNAPEIRGENITHEWGFSFSAFSRIIYHIAQNVIHLQKQQYVN